MKICPCCYEDAYSHGEKLIIMEHSYDEIICEMCGETDEESYDVEFK